MHGNTLRNKSMYTQGRSQDFLTGGGLEFLNITLVSDGGGGKKICLSHAGSKFGLLSR